jgi:hypothetical protein
MLDPLPLEEPVPAELPLEEPVSLPLTGWRSVPEEPEEPVAEPEEPEPVAEPEEPEPVAEPEEPEPVAEPEEPGELADPDGLADGDGAVELGVDEGERAPDLV